MKTIFFFARDPGGANVILPVYKKMEGKYDRIVYAKEVAYERIKKEGIPVRNIEEECGEKEEDIHNFLMRINPEIVITGTSLNDNTERYLWKAAEELGIKSYAILDQWMNLGIRFSKYSYEEMEAYQNNKVHPFLPTRIFVMDELAKTSMVQDGIREDRIVVTGQPHFDVICGKYEQAEESYDKSYWNIVFASEPVFEQYDKNRGGELYWGYNEKTIFMALYQCVKKITEETEIKARMIIRPHPREQEENWKDVLTQYGSEKVKVVCNSKSDSFSLLKSADVVCGMSSMFLLEALICKKDMLSIEIGLRRENPFVLDTLGISKSILTQEELLQKLETILESQKRNQRTEVLEFDYIKNAADNVISFIEEEMAR